VENHENLIMIVGVPFELWTANLRLAISYFLTTNFNTSGWPYWPKHAVFLRTFNEH
jgi:hypothetical protein